MTDSNTVCPESTIESANRRNFIKRAAIVTTAAGIGGTIIGRSLIPESSADSSVSKTVTTSTACSNKAGNIAFFDAASDITGTVVRKAAHLNGCVCGGFVLQVGNGGCGGSGIEASGGLCGSGIVGCGSVGVRGAGYGHCCSCGIGVLGKAKCCFGTGVAGFASGSGIGVSGYSPGSYGNGAGVSGSACHGVGVCASSATSLGLQAVSGSSTVARFSNTGSGKNKSAHIQLENGCSTPSSWFAGVSGSGNNYGATNGQFLLVPGNCQPRLVLNKCGKLGLGTVSPNTTLQVNGGVSVGTKIESSDYAMTSSDFAILANATAKAITIKLPAAGNAGQVVHIKKIDSSNNEVMIARQGTDTLEGVPSKTLPSQYDSLMLIAGGNGVWYILSSAT
jgi:hypothetical protein